MGNVIGLVPVPGDSPLGEFIDKMIATDIELLQEKLGELNLTVEETKESEQPESFAYAKLMNYLATVISHPDLLHLCAAALWSHIQPVRQDGT